MEMNCFIPTDDNNPYPLCVGETQNGETAEKCKHCCLFDDYEVYHPPYPEN